jgi:hypothetical protein
MRNIFQPEQINAMTDQSVRSWQSLSDVDRKSFLSQIDDLSGDICEFECATLSFTKAHQHNRKILAALYPSNQYPEDLIQFLRDINLRKLAMKPIVEQSTSEAIRLSSENPKIAAKRARFAMLEALIQRHILWLLDTVVLFLESGEVPTGHTFYSAQLRHLLKDLISIPVGPEVLDRIDQYRIMIVREYCADVLGGAHNYANEIEKPNHDILASLKSVVEKERVLRLSPTDGTRLPAGQRVDLSSPDSAAESWFSRFDLFGTPMDRYIDFGARPISEESIPDFDLPEADLKLPLDLIADGWRNKRGSIPYGAVVQVDFLGFSHMILFEGPDGVTGAIMSASKYTTFTTDHTMVYPGILSLVNAVESEEERIRITEISRHISLVVAAVIRDFWVIEDRTSLGGAPLRVTPGLPKAITRHEPLVIYLPRYKYNPAQAQSRADALARALDYHARAKHMVCAHVRKLIAGTKASAIQVERAHARGIPVPEGFTFVREHESGVEPERERIYRSRTATGALMDLVAKSVAPVPSFITWPVFERFCRDWLSKNGFEEVHCNPGFGADGGVDIRAIRIRPDGSSERVIAQCKHYRTEAVGVRVVRELEFVRKHQEVDTALLMVSGVVSKDASALAQELGITIIDRGDLFPVRKAA